MSKTIFLEPRDIGHDRWTLATLRFALGRASAVRVATTTQNEKIRGVCPSRFVHARRPVQWPRQMGFSHIHNCPLKGIGVRDFYRGFLCYAIVSRFYGLFDCFLIFEASLRQLSVKFGPSVLGRRDGSIRASRKRRSRNKTDNCPLPKPGWATKTTATATTTEEFSQSIQAPSSTHPGISYPVRANPSLR